MSQTTTDSEALFAKWEEARKGMTDDLLCKALLGGGCYGCKASFMAHCNDEGDLVCSLDADIYDSDGEMNDFCYVEAYEDERGLGGIPREEWIHQGPCRYWRARNAEIPRIRTC